MASTSSADTAVPHNPVLARLHRAAQPYAACVVPLMGRGHRTTYAPRGSGVLFGKDRPQFLLSATHVVEKTRDGETLLMGIGTRIMKLGGSFVATPAKGKGALDVAMCSFPDRTANALDWSGVRWIRPDDILWDKDIVHSAQHVAIGFPHTKQAEYPIDGVLECNAMIHWGSGREPSEVEKLGHSPVTHIMIDFDKNDILGPGDATTSADPYGMSGGGVWYAPDPLRVGRPPWQLSAIAIEWRKGGREKAFLATRVAQSLLLLAQESETARGALRSFLDRAA